MRHGFIAFLILLVSFSNVAGQEFHTYSIEADIIGDTVNERVEITFSEISNLTYVVDGYFDSVKPTSKDGEIVYSVVKGSQSYIVVRIYQTRAI